MCETPGILRVFMIITVLFRIITIILPLIVIITSMISSFKVVVSGKDEDLKSIFPTMIKKIVAGIIIFFLPSIFTFAFSLTEENFYELNVCFTNSNLETINYYEKISFAEQKLTNAENNPTDSNINAAREAISSISGYAKEDTMLDYLERISKAEIAKDEYKASTECERKGGKYTKGYCDIPQRVKPPVTESNTSSSASAGGMSQSDLLNGNYYVIETATNVKSYLSLISSQKIAETKNVDIFGDHCLAFAYLHAYSLYSGNTNARAEDALDYIYASKFDSYDNDSKSDVLEKVYNELKNGRPCIIQVNGNKKGTSRHYVTVVGFKKSVTSANNLTEDDLLIIDSYDGRLESMDTSSSRFMVTGAACHKKYSGYQMYYLE